MLTFVKRQILVDVILRFLRSLSAGGVVLGTIFFAASLTPTLIPRTFLIQGALSGGCFAIGYAIGVGWRWLWRYMELPEPRGRLERWLKIVVLGLCLILAVAFLLKTTAWQNSIHALMAMEPVSSAHPLEVSLIAILTFLALVMLARLFMVVVHLISKGADRVVPPRVSRVIGFSLGIILFWSVANGLLVRYTLHVLDSSFAAFDALFEPDRDQPTSPLQTGSAASLMAWEELGRTGRRFVSSGPSGKDIAEFTGQPALEPIRVYASLRAGDTATERAKLAFDELKRVGGFERSTLVVITPTGTGWVDPAAIDTVEYLHRGDIASVALQYSYLSSPLSLLVEPDYGMEAAQALFAQVYGYWTTLPRDHRPKLYLHGLSLGALNSERSTDIFEILGDPIQGAVWSGPPFASSIWRQVTEARNAGSPMWLPEFRDGATFRFMNQNGPTVPAQTPWGPMRIVYLQYASDAITFFDYRDLYRRPDWMNAPRGPDVSPHLQWFPIVTMLQLAVDMAVANATPMGYGHVFAPEHYLKAWLAVTDPQGWSPEDISRLSRYLAERAR
ncbi:alpha/beta-hydrolase family protein [Sinorhizobium sp. RAC02]|uniref:alpha/beta hydrolase n=1 Tax=Sinorhizobium sp. RAC02 TaxID=1842534 RepID=UPI00083E065E|nr:alpha/beta-hydrolase family protein [Sinorhizobium sp. RAC02]AOF93449.1 alpha/beta-hydrolase family protein [Sinorhizobium sp. RAC02]